MRALVTGASQGIGRAIADRLGEEGYDVVRLDVAGDGVVVCDVGDTDAVAAAAIEVGPIDVLVNNAGIFPYGNIRNSPAKDIERVLRVNLIGVFNCIRSFGEGMIERGKGSIVNIASISAAHPSPSAGAYSASKAGVVALTQQTALDWGPLGVRCNAVGPGMTMTEGTRNAYSDPAVLEARAGAVPLRRLGTPRDIAEVVAFLASDKASYVTGQVIYVDGGLTQSLFQLMPYPARPE
jgi:NAD(P)-dependent dehydrogenase (short-subunit alcohol dehydrogenase family)